MQSKFALLGAFVILTASTLAVFLWNTSAKAIWRFPVENSNEVLVLTCLALEDSTKSEANAQQAHAHFLKNLRINSKAAAKKMQAAMQAANDSGKVPDFSTIKSERRKMHRGLISDIKAQYGCAIKREVP